MDFIDYQNAATETANRKLTKEQALSNWSMGLAGEAGELIDEIKKHLYHGKQLDYDHVVKELGDCLWYLSALASDLGLSLNEIAKVNLVKLRARHRGAFKNHEDQNR